MKIDFNKVRAWTFEALLPFWALHGVDSANGGFWEELSLAGAPTSCAFKRVRTMCRQTFVFTHAALMGWDAGEALSARGCDYMIARAHLGGGAWATTLARDGRVTDAAPDLYDHAFVMFALAWRYKLTGETAIRQHLRATLQFVQTCLGADEGFAARAPDDGVRLQNPHMHLTEACLAAFEATRDQCFLDQARALAALFRRRLFDGETLGERFAADWTRRPSQVLEPGHHFEWAWILAQYQQVTGEPLEDEVKALVAFCETRGVDAATGAVLDAVDSLGAPLKRSSRAWTNTERIKGWLGLYELSGRDPRGPIAQTLDLLFGRYFAATAPGGWIDQFDLDGRPISRTIPASIPYHILLAFSELLRLEPRLVRLQ